MVVRDPALRAPMWISVLAGGSPSHPGPQRAACCNRCHLLPWLGRGPACRTCRGARWCCIELWLIVWLWRWVRCAACARTRRAGRVLLRLPSAVVASQTPAFRNQLLACQAQPDATLFCKRSRPTPCISFVFEEAHVDLRDMRRAVHAGHEAGFGFALWSVCASIGRDLLPSRVVGLEDGRQRFGDSVRSQVPDKLPRNLMRIPSIPFWPRPHQ